MKVTYNKWPWTKLGNQNNNTINLCLTYKSNLSGGLTSLEDLWSGASVFGHLNCGIWTGASEGSVVCSQLSREVLGMVLQTSFRAVSGSSLGMLFWMWIFSPVGRIWLRFPLRVLPFAMVTVYEREACVLHLTIPGSHLWSCGLSTRTGSSGCKAGRGLEDLSYYDLCWSCRAWSLEFTSPSADNNRPGLDMHGRLAWYTLELRSSAGDAMLWSSGVLRRHNMARWGSAPDSLHFWRRFFTVCMVLSMKPLACG